MGQAGARRLMIDPPPSDFGATDGDPIKSEGGDCKLEIWVSERKHDTTAFRVGGLFGAVSQGSLALRRKGYGGQATLDWRMQSFWDKDVSAYSLCITMEPD